MLQGEHFRQKSKEKKDTLLLHWITQWGKFNIPETVVIKNTRSIWVQMLEALYRGNKFLSWTMKIIVHTFVSLADVSTNSTHACAVPFKKALIWNFI